MSPIAPSPPAAAFTEAGGGSAREVFLVFLRLGLTSFGGPAAHVGYFRTAFVERRRWLDEAAFADRLALCQFLPGPASSQLGLAIGLHRAGPLGALAAWVGFTAPSAVLMTLLGLRAGALHGRAAGGLIHGLKLAAVAVVAQAVWGMARTLAPDRARAAVAVGALALASLLGGWGQIAALALGALVGLGLKPVGEAPSPAAPALGVSRAAGALCLSAFAGLLIALPAFAAVTGAPVLQTAAAFYRSGALVFGGGHVVLPLLQDQVVRPGWIAPDRFLAGYAAAQAMPGPLFTVAAYLGAIIPPGGVLGAMLALFSLFLPGILILFGVLPFWSAVQARSWAQAAMRGANAAVVGVLGAALYSPVSTSAVHGPLDLVIAAAAFTALTVWRAPPILVVAACALVGLRAV